MGTQQDSSGRGRELRSTSRKSRDSYSSALLVARAEGKSVLARILPRMPRTPPRQFSRQSYPKSHPRFLVLPSANPLLAHKTNSQNASSRFHWNRASCHSSFGFGRTVGIPCKRASSGQEPRALDQPQGSLFGPHRTPGPSCSCSLPGLEPALGTWARGGRDHRDWKGQARAPVPLERASTARPRRKPCLAESCGQLDNHQHNHLDLFCFLLPAWPFGLLCRSDRIPAVRHEGRGARYGEGSSGSEHLYLSWRKWGVHYFLYS